MRKKLFLLFFMISFCFAEIPHEFSNICFCIINLPFPPYQRNVVRLVESEDGKIYGIVSESPYGGGFVFAMDEGEKIKRISRLPDDILQIDSIVFNPELTWTWDKTYKKILVVDNTGVLKVYEKNSPAREISKISGTRPFEPQGYQISCAFAFDKDGNIYTAGKDGFLFKFDPKTCKIEKMKIQLPAVKGREAWASLDAATLADDGTIYLGTFDGYIVQFNPETQTIVNLGKPLRQQRIQSLVFYKGVVFGIGGEPDGLPRWFVYDPKTRSFELGGTLKDKNNKLIYEPINTMILTKNGQIFGSFFGRLGSLFKIEMVKTK
ncbi:MAG: hypothetical protein NC906_06830 [Candidatus Omnitrophica bacterium]|nr:hypothetical protein [Candidatus Omnitrophota bacterium]